MFCYNCGKEIDDKAVICVGCGVAVNEKKPKSTRNKEHSIVIDVLLNVVPVLSFLFAILVLTVFIGGLDVNLY